MFSRCEHVRRHLWPRCAPDTSPASIWWAAGWSHQADFRPFRWWFLRGAHEWMMGFSKGKLGFIENDKNRARDGLNECKKREGPHKWHDFDNVDECWTAFCPHCAPDWSKHYELESRPVADRKRTLCTRWHSEAKKSLQCIIFGCQSEVITTQNC